MITVSNRDAVSQHPLTSYTHPLADLASNTGETIRLIYNDHSVDIFPEDTGSTAWERWHSTYTIRRDQL